MNVVEEPRRLTPVVGDYDVVVVGGGIAGVAAALAARRRGASVCLVERTCGLGGLATVGNVIVFLPLCDGRGRQVIGGLGEELLRLSVRDVKEPIPSLRISPVPACWDCDSPVEARARTRFRVGFNPVTFQLALEEQVLEEGIALHYDTRFCSTSGTGGRVEALFIENKSGRGALRAKAVVDATGDADVCASAGEPTASLATNVACGWFYSVDSQGTGVELHCMSEHFDAAGGPVPEGRRGYAGDCAEDVTALVVDSHRLMLDKVSGGDGEASRSPIMIPSIPSFRMTRRLRGEVELCEEDDHRIFPDAVGMTGDWRKAGPVYMIPLRMLSGVCNDNLFAAGRCVSAVGRTWDAVRAIPTCVVTGEAAGATAALRAGVAPGDGAAFSLEQLQRSLTQHGVILDPSLVE